MRAYYNEIDPGAAATLRELIKHNLIAPGDVDERSIEDVVPTDLVGYTQCHFFAGIGVWSHALRLAGWPDDRPVWTGSCPCQPFSPAGKGKGFDDERHLWPAFFHLIDVCGPERVFGEQVAGKDGLGWLDLVSTDLEAVGYACGAVPFPAAGIGAPHIRERLYWVADRDDARLEGRGQPGCERAAEWPAGACGLAGGLADCAGARPLSGAHPGIHRGQESAGARHGEPERSGAVGRPGPTNGHWRDADWLGCRDGSWRPVEPGTFPLAHGAAERVGRLRGLGLSELATNPQEARVMRLRGYGNAIVAQQAQAFVEAYMEVSAGAV